MLRQMHEKHDFSTMYRIVQRIMLEGIVGILDRGTSMVFSISRRQFAKAIVSGVAVGTIPFVEKTLPRARADWQANVNANITIDGLSIPAFTWAWFGTQIASGILGGIGGLIFTKFLDHAFGQQKKSYEQLFGEQLAAFGELLDKKFEQEALRKMSALLTATQRNMAEYMTAPTMRDRLDFAINDSQKLIAELEQFPESGYRAYMQAAGLRLAILQERAKSDTNERKNFERAREQYVDHHRQSIKRINGISKRLSGATIVTSDIRKLPSGAPKNSARIHLAISRPPGTSDRPFGLNVEYESTAALTEIVADKRAELQTARAKTVEICQGKWRDAVALWERAVKAENTDLGEKMVQRWREFRF